MMRLEQLAIQPDGKLIVAGFAGATGSQQFALVRLSPSAQ
jgi:hypothetical protein